MSERVGKIGLNAGTPWSLFAENTAFEDSEGIADPKGGNTETGRLHKEDMRLFGLCPVKDNLMLAVCKECNKIIQTSMFAAHYERKHPKMLSSLKRSPSRRCSVSKEILSPSHTFGKSKLLKSPGDNSFIRIEEVDPTDINVKIEEVPLMIPKFNHAAKGKLAKTHAKNMASSKGKPSGEIRVGNAKLPQKKQIASKDKEYDPERHCGVWIEEQTRNCTRSLTCKTHSLASRREVTGRSKLFDVLLADHKARMQNSKEGGSSSGATTPSATPSPTRTNTPTFPLKSERTPTDPRSPLSKEHSRSEGKRHCSSDDHSSPFTQSQPTYIDYITEDRTLTLPSIPRHPKPLAVNTFASRRTGSGCLFFTRRLETFRHAAQSMVDKFIKAKSCASNSQSSLGKFSEANGMCSTQVIDEGLNLRGLSSSSSSMNSYSSTDASRFGSVPRVKTKSHKTNSANSLKREFSESSIAADFSSSRKRRHSSDSLKNESVSKDATGLLENSLNDNNNSQESAIDLAKCVNEIGQALRGFDVESLDANFISGALLSSDSSQSGVSNLTITGGNISSSQGTDTGLNSSLSLCQTVGLNHGLSPNLSLNLGAAQNPIVLDHGQVSQLLAPNIAVTKGMMVSLPNVSQVQNLSAYQGSLKEILPAPTSGKQQNTQAGLQVQQAVAKLANGTVSSPDTFNLSYSPCQAFSTTSLNTTLKVSNAQSASVSKRLAIPGNQRASQLVVRQPPQTFQRDVNTQRSNPFQKTGSYEPRKASSPNQKSPNPSRSPLQQPSATASQFTTTSQPIAQLKQIQMQQLQQQQHQLMSPLNSSIQAESLSYQQQILPKLVVSPSRNLPAQIVNAQTLQVNSQHMQQRSVLEPSTP